MIRLINLVWSDIFRLDMGWELCPSSRGQIPSHMTPHLTKDTWNFSWGFKSDFISSLSWVRAHSNHILTTELWGWISLNLRGNHEEGPPQNYFFVRCHPGDSLAEILLHGFNAYFSQWLFAVEQIKQNVITHRLYINGSTWGQISASIKFKVCIKNVPFYKRATDF